MASEQAKVVDESFRHYRASQLALSATIIAISGTILYWVKDSTSWPDMVSKVLLGLAVCAALLMQLLHAFGYKHQARSDDYLLEASVDRFVGLPDPELMRKCGREHKSATKFFTWLDRVTLAAFALCIAGLLIVGGLNLFNQGTSTPATIPPPFEDLN